MAEEFPATEICAGTWWNNSSKNLLATCFNTDPTFSGWQNMNDNNNNEDCSNNISVFAHKQQNAPDSDSGNSSSVLVDPGLHMMGFGFSSPATSSSDWNMNETGRVENCYNSIIQETAIDSTQANFPMTSSVVTSSPYIYSSRLLQTLLEPPELDQTNQTFYDNNHNSINNYMASCSLKQQNSLQFSNSTQFWNAGLNDAGSVDFSSSPPFPTNYKEAKISNTEEVQNFAKKSSNAPVTKRARIQTPSPLPTFKVRKEKLGDRITALQQLVSPFGKTDTASVLHEAIDYIKLLHDQVNVLSTPYMKQGGSIQHQQDLKSRGLCLVPISSTFPVANATTSDFWTPNFGGTFR